jgi:O-antigen/teichoic acid export membrane protein
MRIPAIPGFDQSAFEKYFKNTGWLMLGRVGSLFIKMLISFAVTNYLGKGQNGILNYANSFVIMFMAVAGLGLDSFIVRELVREPQRKNEILGTSLLLKIAAALVIIPVILLGYLLFPDEQTPAQYVFILSFTGLFQAFNIIDAYFQAQVQAKYIMYVNIVGNMVSAVVKLVLILLEFPLEYFVFALLFDAVLLALGYILVYRSRQQFIRNWSFNRELAKTLLSKSWPLMFAAVLVTIYMKIDQVMIGRILGTEALGIYSTVVPLSEVWYFIPMSIVGSVFPAIINARAESMERYQRRLQNLYDLMVGMSLTIAIIMTFASGFIYDIVYTPEFASGAPVLSLHVWAGIFVFLGVASGQYLINEGLTQLSLFRTAVGAVINILLNLMLLPKFGIIGAAWATLAAYALATFSIILIPKTRAQGIMMLKSLFLISLIQKLIKR